MRVQPFAYFPLGSLGFSLKPKSDLKKLDIYAVISQMII
jgi:hypothetical protein